MKILSGIFFLLTFTLVATAQTCTQYARLVKQGDSLSVKKNYREALNKYNAAKLCAPENAPKVDKKVSSLFDRIEKDKDEAQKQRDLAEIATEEALRKTHEATALYLASEADKLSPGHGLRLLEEAELLAGETPRAMDFIGRQATKIFNESNAHKFSEKFRFDNLVIADFTPDGRFFLFVDEYYRALGVDLENGDLRDFSGDAKEIYGIAITPDSKWLITLDGSSELKVWDLETAVMYDFLDSKDMRSASYTPNSKYIVVTYNDSTAKVWDLASGKLQPFLERETGITKIAYSSDSHWAVTWYADSMAKVWDIVSGERINVMRGEKGLIAAEFSNDGKWLVSYTDSTTKLWNLDSMNILETLAKETGIVQTRFSPDSRWLLAQYADTTAKVFGLKSDKSLNFKKSNEKVATVSFSPDSKWAVAVDPDSVATIWNLETGEIHEFLDGKTTIRRATFSPDGKWLLTSYADSTTMAWDLVSGKLHDVFRYDKNISDVLFSPDSKSIIIQNLENAPKVLEVATGKIHEFLSNEEKIDRVLFSVDGRRIMTVAESQVKVWEPQHRVMNDLYASGRVIRGSSRTSLEGRNTTTANPDSTTRGKGTGVSKTFDFLNEKSPIASASLSSDGKWILTVHDDLRSRLWELESGSIPNFLLKEKEMYDALFSADSRWFTCKGSDGSYKLWDLSAGTLSDIGRDRPDNKGMSLSPDAKSVTVIYPNSGAKVFELSTGKPYYTVGFDTDILNVYYSPDSKWLVAVRPDSTLIIEDLSLNAESQWFSSSERFKTAIFSADGKRLFTRGNDSKAYLWNLENQKPDTLLAKEGSAYDLVFSPDSQWIITKYHPDEETGITSTDENVQTKFRVKLWNIRTGEQVNFFEDQAEFYNISFSKDSKFVLTKDGVEVGIWSLNSRENIYTSSDASGIQSIDQVDVSDLFILSYDYGMFDVLDVSSKGIIMSNFDEAFERSISPDGKRMLVLLENSVRSYDLSTGEILMECHFDVYKKLRMIGVAKNGDLYVAIGNNVVKIESESRGAFFHFGSFEKLKYSYEDVKSWMEKFGNDFLPPLSSQMKAVYGIE